MGHRLGFVDSGRCPDPDLSLTFPKGRGTMIRDLLQGVVLPILILAGVTGGIVGGLLFLGRLVGLL